MLRYVLEALTGTGLAASAGLNAYIPLLAVGLLARYSDLLDLPGGWQWLSNGWMLGLLAVLLTIEVIADKVPTVDHINDVVQTVVRPTAGGLVFGAGSSSETLTVSDPSAFLDGNRWVPVAIGVVIALCVHGAKASIRPIINMTTAGLGAPIVSTVEDVISIVMAVVAILLPVLVLVLLALMVFGFSSLLRKRRRRRVPASVLPPAGR